jgi:type I restriction enzyme S subunit
VRLSKYTEYKNSGVDWIGFAPTHWPIKRFKHIFFERNERSVTGTEELLSVSEYYGVKPRTEKMSEGDHLSRAESLEGYKLCKPSDLVMNIMLAWKRGLGFSHYHGIVSPAYCVFSVIDGSIPDFLGYLVRSNEYVGYFKTFSSGVIDSRLRLYPEVFGRLTAVVPSIIEQSQIARFLDHETAKIDTLIHEQKRLIELLKEKRQAVISHAVTKGLDPDVPMKDSEVEWLGEVPAHWTKKRLKNVSPFIAVGIVVNPSSYVAEDGLPFIYGGEVKEGYIDLSKTRKISALDSKKNKKTLLETGDLVTMRVGYPGVTAIVPPSCEGGNCASVMLVKRGDFDSRWLCAVMNSRLIRQQVEVVQYGAAQKQFNIADAVEFWLLEPPQTEQAVIADFITAKSAGFDQLMDKASQSMSLLAERRSALISAAITGEIDVRDWQPPESESASDERIRQTEIEVRA